MFLRIITPCVFAIAVAMTASKGAAEDANRRKSLAALQNEVQSLKVEKVAWRKIAWKTCLLDGLKASREQKKPMMLWVFIDRPIDDERC